MPHQTYATRALQAKDPRFADILRKLGHIKDEPEETEEDKANPKKAKAKKAK